MCLSRLHRTDFPPEEEREGWKVIRYENSSWLPPIKKLEPLPFNQWIEDTSDVDIETHEGYYKSGFHVFESEEAAKNYGVKGEFIVKVKGRNLTACGSKDGNLVFVAREIFVEFELHSV